jgi:16S rRNA (cytosine1402-N4)-methyltransferase
LTSLNPMQYLSDGFVHRPVLYQECIDALRPERGGSYVDGTLGAGGHAWGILQASAPDGQLLGMDVDPQALVLARQRLIVFGERAFILQASYASLSEQLHRLGWSQVNGVLLDLGLSSMQLDTGERGFSFQVDAPLDMRFDPNNPVRAADLVNTLPADELAQLIFQYGEEPQARRIAQAIVTARPVLTTAQLADVVVRITAGGRRRNTEKRSQARPASRSRTAPHHPATRTFQALRIAVNRELDALQAVLPQAVAVLAPGGRLAVISFHSLEDRIVKQFFRRESQDCLCPPRQPVCTCGHRASLLEVTRHPLIPQPEEVQQNHRARSARLRVAEKLGDGLNTALC